MFCPPFPKILIIILNLVLKVWSPTGIPICVLVEAIFPAYLSGKPVEWLLVCVGSTGLGLAAGNLCQLV